MLVSAIFLIFFVIFLLILYGTNGFTKVISVYLLAISIIIISGVVYLSKTMQPPIQFGIEYKLFFYFRLIRMPLSTIVRFFNFSLFLFMTATVIYLRYLYQLGWKKTVLLLIPCIYMLFSIDPYVSKMLYFMSSSQSFDTRYFDSKYMEYVIFINKSLLVLYMIVPVLCAIKKFFKMVVFVKKKDVITSGACILLVHILVFAALFNGMFKNIMFYNVNVGKLPLVLQIKSDTFIPMLLLWSTIIILLFITIFLRPFRIFEKSNSIEVLSLHENNNKEMSMVLHAYKNAFLGVSQQFTLVKTNIEKGAYDRAVNHTEIGNGIATEQLNALKKTLSFFARHNTAFKCTDLLLCINKAMRQVYLPTDINMELEVLFCEENISVFGDEQYLTEMFLNLLINSVEALNKKDNNRNIKITVFQEEDLVQINVRDNGCGISKKDMRKIFRLFFTTKSSMSGGVGLSYVLKAIKKHHGEIRVKSTKDVFTEFQIVLPVYQKKGRKWYV